MGKRKRINGSEKEAKRHTEWHSLGYVAMVVVKHHNENNRKKGFLWLMVPEV